MLGFSFVLSGAVLLMISYRWMMEEEACCTFSPFLEPFPTSLSHSFGLIIFFFSALIPNMRYFGVSGFSALN